MDRRTFIKGTIGAGATMLGADALATRFGAAATRHTASPPPNILVIMVDEMRYARWNQMSAAANQAIQDTYMPHLAALRTDPATIQFGRHYAAANGCSPARATLLTGLYGHQTALVNTLRKGQTGGTNPPALNPGFPTWATMLRGLGLGYNCYWFGKWHLSSDDKQGCFGQTLAPYGFNFNAAGDYAGGTCPIASFDGTPGEGLYFDPAITLEFQKWWAGYSASGPWCTTVSFVNPHDIAFYYDGVTGNTDRIRGEDAGFISPVFSAPPLNLESPAHLQQTKPSTQYAYLQALDVACGTVPGTDPGAPGGPYNASWPDMLNLYLLLHYYVDIQIGKVLDVVNQSPAASNTIIIFTADHGEYAGAHGLRGKQGAVYDEAFRVPLYVKDPTQVFVPRASQPQPERGQMTSSVDIAPLLLTLATGSRGAWAGLPRFSHLADRCDLGAILRTASSPGRPYLLHTTDELFSTATELTHGIGYRTKQAKLGQYDAWTRSTNPQVISVFDTTEQPEETESYDYTQANGYLEVTNVDKNANGTYTPLHDQLYAELRAAISGELRAVLPAQTGAPWNLAQAQEQAIDDYWTWRQTLPSGDAVTLNL